MVRASVSIRTVGPEHAGLVLMIMLEAFEEYRQASPPTSALKETETSIIDEMNKGGVAAVGYIDDVPAAMVRFYVHDGLYFHRLAVRPAYRGRGAGRSMLLWLEAEAARMGEASLWCKVRASVPRNIALYQRLGYSVEREAVEANPNGDPVRIVYMRKRLVPAHS